MEELILNGLRELSKTAFPRKCETCGKVFYSFSEFVNETNQLVGRSGLIESCGFAEESNSPIVELYRNCSCGSTLMEFFNNRRDTSRNGRRRRAIFGKMVEVLVERGLSREDARRELLLILQFNRSPLLEGMGIHVELK